MLPMQAPRFSDTLVATAFSYRPNDNNPGLELNPIFCNVVKYSFDFGTPSGIVEVQRCFSFTNPFMVKYVKAARGG